MPRCPKTQPGAALASIFSTEREAKSATDEKTANTFVCAAVASVWRRTVALPKIFFKTHSSAPSPWKRKATSESPRGNLESGKKKYQNEREQEREKERERERRERERERAIHGIFLSLSHTCHVSRQFCKQEIAEENYIHYMQYLREFLIIFSVRFFTKNTLLHVFFFVLVRVVRCFFLPLSSKMSDMLIVLPIMMFANKIDLTGLWQRDFFDLSFEFDWY
jgi:hypothetical protein